MDQEKMMQAFAEGGNPTAALKRLIEPGDINIKTRLGQKQIKRITQLLFWEISKKKVYGTYPVGHRFHPIEPYDVVPKDKVGEEYWPDPMVCLQLAIEALKEFMVSYNGLNRKEIVEGTKGTHVDHKEEQKTQKEG